MKQTITIVRDDGQGSSKRNLAAQGVNGDTQLAHVNPWEQALLKALGGSGTRNPRTGLRQFYPNEEDFFNIPLDIMPSSGSTNQSTSNSDAVNLGLSNARAKSRNESANVGNQQSWNISNNTATNQSKQQSQSESSSYTGLPQQYIKQLLGTVIPALTSSVGNIEGNYDRYTQEALGSYMQMLQNAIRQNVPTAISGLANRGIINSSEGANTLGKVLSDAAINASTKGYETAMQMALLKANIPNILTNIAKLGESTTSSGTSSSSGSSSGSSLGTSLGQSLGNTYGYSLGDSDSISDSFNFGTSNANSQSTGSSYSQDPTVMYQTMANLINSMMG